MARKGNQQRNGVDSQGLNDKRKGLGTGDEVSGTKWNTKATRAKVFPGEKLKQSCNPAENMNGFSAEAENRSKNKFFQGDKLNQSSNPVEGSNGINCESEKRSKKRGFRGGKLKQSSDPAENINGVSAGTENRSKKKVIHGEKVKQSSNSDDNVNGFSAGTENRSKRNHRRFGKREKPEMDVAVELEESVPLGYTSEDVVEDSEAPAVQENEDISSRGDQPQKDRTDLSSLLSSLYMRNIAENVDFADNLVVRGLKESTVSFIKDISTWIESCKPMFTSFTTRFSAACEYCSMNIMSVYSIVLKWLKYFGNILLLLSIIWLDCALRGIYSFIRLGTTCFFSVMWCSVFSVLGMIGMAKFLFILVSAALVGFFFKFILAVLVVLISGITFLWLYGSFWTTSLIIFIGGLAFLLHHERVTLLITTSYSMYCAWTYTGWFGLFLGLTLSFVSSDVLIYFLKNKVSHPRREDEFRDQNAGIQGQSGFSNDDSFHAPTSENDPGFSANRSAGEPSTSGAETEMTSEDEVVRLLNCSDHYAALGFARYQNIDVSLLKREYRKKAMLVHPDKNMGNDKAAEAFKKLQNGYEVLLDSLKRKAYDDELRREELLSVFRSFQDASLKNRRHGFFNPGFAQPDVDTEDPFGESKRIACRKCGGFHIWVYMVKPKSRARWCQDCQDFHQAKDGDGWVEQSSQPLLFGLLQKVDTPSAYVCADSKIYNATEWYICQGMRCPANTHKPSFHVNTSINSKHNTGKETSSGLKGGRIPTSNMEESMTEEEFFEWMQNAVQAGMFDPAGGSTSDFPSPKTGNHTKSYGGNSGSGSRRRKKGKKQW